MTYGIRTGSIIKENRSAYSAQQVTNRWISGRKMLCWACQKDVPMKMGRQSFAISNRGGTKITSGNALRKFVCFTCKPETP